MLELLPDSLYKMWTVKTTNGAMTNGQRVKNTHSADSSRAAVSSHTHSSAQSNRHMPASHTLIVVVTKTDSFQRCFHTSFLLSRQLIVGVLFPVFKNVLKFII